MNIHEIFPGPPMSVTFTKTIIQEQAKKPDLMKMFLITGICVVVGMYIYNTLIKGQLES